MKAILFSLVTVLYCSSIALGQGYDPRRSINVSGTAELKVKPDQVVISMAIETNNMSLDKARQENDSKVSSVLAMAKKLGIEDKFIQTDYLHVEPRYDNQYTSENEPMERKFLGYFMTKNITIILKDISKYEPLIAEALKLGTNYVHGAEFQLADSRKQKDQARLDAIRAAKEKATALASELGEKLGKPLYISEDVDDNTYAPNATRKMSFGSFDASNDISSVAPGELTISSTVRVSFELN